MYRFALVTAACLALLSTSPSRAVIDYGEVTADGTWDCKDQAGMPMGTIVLANTSYAFRTVDGTLAGYGEVYSITAGGEIDLPAFAMVSGYMKDELRSSGFSMRGPHADPFDYTGLLYLNVVMSEDGSKYWDCLMRQVPAS